MKRITLRCEDLARGGSHTPGLLEGAKVAHLQHIAQAGAAGLLHRPKHEPALDRFALHRALFGIGADDPVASPAGCYAASMNLRLGPNETAWCCELVTQQDGMISDATAGEIPTKESAVLLQALNDHLGSETRRWQLGEGSHHLLIVRDPVFEADGPAPIRAPELLVGRPWRQQVPKTRAGESLRSLMEQAAKLLEAHPVNRVRVDLGENPANLAWFWGSASPRAIPAVASASGAVVSSSFPMRGFAASLGLDWAEGPASFAQAPLRRWAKGVIDRLERYDVVYVHVRVTSAVPVDRLCAMERIDQSLLKPLTETLPSLGPWRLLVAIDDRASESVPVVAIGSGLPQQPIAHLDRQSFADSPLVFRDGLEVFSWFTK